MPDSPSPPRPYRRARAIAAIAAAVLLLAAVAAGVIGLLGGPSPGVPTAPATPPAAPSVSPHAADPLRIPGSADPIPYARTVAQALFEWDAGSGLSPGDYRDAVLAHTGDGGSESNGLYHDVGGYLPAEDLWPLLREMSVRQRLEITSAVVPDGWAEAAEHPLAGLHTVAVTIDGVRHRSGVWDGEDTTSESPVAFTLFLDCPPGQGCMLLRLSRPDAPLR